jgi:thiol-disulfide isomerase/thioredoxin
MSRTDSKSIGSLATIDQLKNKILSSNSQSEMEDLLSQMRVIHGKALEEQSINYDKLKEIKGDKKNDYINLSLNESVLFVIHEVIRESETKVYKGRQQKSKETTPIVSNKSININSATSPNAVGTEGPLSETSPGLSNIVPKNTKTLNIKSSNSKSNVGAKIIQSESGTNKIDLSIPPTTEMGNTNSESIFTEGKQSIKGGAGPSIGSQATESTTEQINNLNTERIKELLSEVDFEKKKQSLRSDSNIPIEHLDPNKTTIVNYHANWCGFSKKFKPQWDNFKELAKSKFPNLQVIDLDVGDDQNLNDLAGKAGVKGYPTVVLFHKGKMYTRGGGEAKSIIEFVENNMK